MIKAFQYKTLDHEVVMRERNHPFWSFQDRNAAAIYDPKTCVFKIHDDATDDPERLRRWADLALGAADHMEEHGKKTKETARLREKRNAVANDIRRAENGAERQRWSLGSIVITVRGGAGGIWEPVVMVGGPPTMQHAYGSRVIAAMQAAKAWCHKVNALVEERREIDRQIAALTEVK